MSNLRTIIITGKTVEDAVHAALEQLRLSRDNVTVTVLDEGSKGVFGLGAKSARVEVTEVAPEPRVAPTPEPSPAVTTSEPSPRGGAGETDTATGGDTTAAAAAYVERIVSLLGYECGVDASEDGDRIALDVRIETQPVEGRKGSIIGRHGETIDAIQYIANLYINRGRASDDFRRVTLDSEGYRARREKSLKQLANTTATKVARFKREITLDPMTPYERRIIHSALQSNKSVTTRSIGEEPNRRVVVQYKR